MVLMLSRFQRLFSECGRLWVDIERNSARVGIIRERVIGLPWNNSFVAIRIPRDTLAKQHLKQGEYVCYFEYDAHAYEFRSPVSGRNLTFNPEVVTQERISSEAMSSSKMGWIYKLDFDDIDEVSKLRKSIVDPIVNQCRTKYLWKF